MWDWLENPARRETLGLAYASALEQSPQSWPAILAAGLVLSVADVELLASLGQLLLRESADSRGQDAVHGSRPVLRGKGPPALTQAGGSFVKNNPELVKLALS